MKKVRALLFFACVSFAATGPQTASGAAAPIRYGSIRTKKFDVITSVKLSWYNALAYCKERHTELATVRSREENDAIIDLMHKSGVVAEPMTSFWIGGTDLSSPRGFFWMSDGDTVGGYVNWHLGEPDRYKGIERCMTYFYNPGFERYKYSVLLKWNDDRCENEFNFVCEYF